jgi:hypothetical protein
MQFLNEFLVLTVGATEVDRYGNYFKQFCSVINNHSKKSRLFSFNAFKRKLYYNIYIVI